MLGGCKRPAPPAQNGPIIATTNYNDDDSVMVNQSTFRIQWENMDMEESVEKDADIGLYFIGYSLSYLKLGQFLIGGNNIYHCLMLNFKVLSKLIKLIK